MLPVFQDTAKLLYKFLNANVKNTFHKLNVHAGWSRHCVHVHILVCIIMHLQQYCACTCVLYNYTFTHTLTWLCPPPPSPAAWWHPQVLPGGGVQAGQRATQGLQTFPQNEDTFCHRESAASAVVHVEPCALYMYICVYYSTCTCIYIEVL